MGKKQLRNKLAEKLMEENTLLRERIALLEKRGELLSQENAFLRQKVDLLVRRVFGVSSEKIDPSQLDLFLLQAESAPGKSPASSTLEEAEPHSPSRAKAKRGRERWPQDLPVIVQVVDPEEVQAEPQRWRCIGEEISEQLDYEPARFLRRRLVRRKYVSRENPEVAPIIARLPSLLQERAGAAPGLPAQIIVSKYCDSPATLSAGTNLSHAAWGEFIAPHDGTLGGTGGRLVEAHLPMHPHRGDGRRLCSSRRKPGALPLAGKWQDQDRILLDRVASWR